MRRYVPVLLLILLLTGCSGGETAPKMQKKTIYAMDTVMTITVYPASGQSDAEIQNAMHATESEIQRLDALLSVTNPQGDIARLNELGTYHVSQETGELLQRALATAADTGGAYDPTVYPLMVLWGFPSEEYHVPTEEELEAVLPQVGYQQVTLSEEDWLAALPQGGGIDLGGIAKGYTAHEVLEVLDRQGITSGIISLGGNVGTLGKKPDGRLWTVAVENPDKSGDYLGTIQLGGGMFAITSGAYERYFEQDGVRYHHILDPATGYPADTGLLSVTVVSSDGTLADALSTALFVMGKDRAQDFWREHSSEFDMILYDGTALYVTPGLTLDTTYPVTEVTP